MERIVLKHLSGSKANQVEEFPLNHVKELVLGRDPSSTVKYDRLPEDRPVLIALAAHVGKTRLIDNIVIQPARPKNGATGRLTLPEKP